MAVQQVAPVSCPNCGTQFNAPIQSIIDAADVALKSALLQGQLNVVQCPNCGFSSAMNAPILYHDAEKELAFALVPGGLQMSNADQEKVIGQLTNTVMNDLPPEQRKFYILNPKVFLSRDSLIKAVLEAEGITEEMMEAQSARVKLLEEFMQIKDEETFKQKVKENDDRLDREFFEVLTASIQAAQMEGNNAGAQALFGLRTAMARFSSQGRKIVKEIDEELGLVFLQNQEELLERLQNAGSDEEFESLVAAGHPLLNYSFFQQLTAKIDQAAKEGDAKKAETFKALRARILEVKSRHEEMSRAAVKKSAELLKEILQSGQADKIIQEKLDEIDSTFFAVLSANIEQARQQKQEQAARALEMIGNMAMSMLQARSGGAKKGEEAAGEQPGSQESTPSSEILISSR